MLNNLSEAVDLSEMYDIPVEDIILIDLNSTGVNSNLNLDRIRFTLKLESFPEEFYVALPITQKSPFFLSYETSQLLFDGKPVGIVKGVENDTCDNTYFRRNKTVLTLNSNCRSTCKGCEFCATYVQDAQDLNNLTTEKSLRVRMEEIKKENDMEDLSNLIEVAICTGCFPDEEKTRDHLVMVRETLDEMGFTGELKYIGAQITSEESLDILRKTSPFSLYLTVECFTRREQLMKPIKSKVTVSKGKQILKHSLQRGFDTSILYIIGLDPLDLVTQEFKDYVPYLSRFPIINLFQNYKPEQQSLRDPKACAIEYYLEARKELERIYKSSGLRPRPWENYRPLWYSKFSDEDIHEIRI